MSRGLKYTKKASWHNGKFKRELIQNDPPHLRSKGVEFFMSIFDIKMSIRHKNVCTTHFPSVMIFMDCEMSNLKSHYYIFYVKSTLLM